jgi:hypothetical protein
MVDADENEEPHKFHLYVPTSQELSDFEFDVQYKL